MSKYDNRRFYWLQLQEDFFDDDAIQYIEEQQNGKDYVLFYLKLCAKSLKTNGILIRNIGNMLIPYDVKKIAELTRTDPDTVLVAMKLFEEVGLIRILENGEIYMQQLQNMIGSKSIGAFRKAQQRILCRQKADICPPNIDIDTDIDNSNSNNNSIDNICNFYEKKFEKQISDLEKDFFIKWLDLYSTDIIKYAILIAKDNDVPKISYINGILSNWQNQKYNNLEDIQNAMMGIKQPNALHMCETGNSQSIEEIFDYNWFEENDEAKGRGLS